MGQSPTPCPRSCSRNFARDRALRGGDPLQTQAALPVAEEDSDVSKNFFSRDSSVQGGIWAVAHRTDDEQPAPSVSAITPPGRILIRLWNGEL